MKSALVAVGVLAALLASGAATMRQAANAGMEGPVPFALVVLLEVVNVAGTWTWMTDPRVRVQVEAAIGVGAASFVTGACGVLTYGPLGIVAAAGVLFTVHLGGRLRHRAAKPDVEDATENALDASLPDLAPRPVATIDPAAIERAPAPTYRWRPLDPPIPREPEPEPVDDPETVEPRLPDPEPDPKSEPEGNSEDEGGDDERRDADHRLIPWDQLNKEQAAAEARRLTDRGHRVTQSGKKLPELRADIRDARRALGEPAA